MQMEFRPSGRINHVSISAILAVTQVSSYVDLVSLASEANAEMDILPLRPSNSALLPSQSTKLWVFEADRLLFHIWTRFLEDS